MNLTLSTAVRLIQAAANSDDQLQRTARAFAALLVLLYVIVADLVTATYRAGFALGSAVHRLNDRLADPASLAAQARAAMQAWLEEQRASLLAFLLLEVA